MAQIKKILLESMIEKVEKDLKETLVSYNSHNDYDIDNSSARISSIAKKNESTKIPMKRIENLSRILNHLYSIDPETGTSINGSDDFLNVYEVKPKLGEYDCLVVTSSYPSFSKKIGRKNYFTVSYKSEVGKKLLNSKKGNEIKIGDNKYKIKKIE